MNGGTVGPRVDPPWWNLARQLTIFLLGIFCVLYATVTPGHDATFIISGLILIGLVPVDMFLTHRNGRS